MSPEVFLPAGKRQIKYTEQAGIRKPEEVNLLTGKLVSDQKLHGSPDRPSPCLLEQICLAILQAGLIIRVNGNTPNIRCF